MEKIIKYLKSFGLSDAEISKVLKDVPADPAGLMGTKVSKGIFEKGGKKEMAEHPLFSEELKNPFLTDTYKGKTRDEAIDLAEKGVKFLDDELTKASDLILNKNLSLSPGQREIFSRNLQMKRNFERDLENLKSKPAAPVVDIKTRKQIETKEAEPEFDFTGILQEAGQGQLSLAKLHNEGLVRAAARQILYEDIKTGKIKGMSLDDLSKVKDPIENFRGIYGEGALEQLDSLTPDFNRLTSPQEASELARKKYTFEPRDEPLKESMTYDELGKIIKESPEEKASGGSVGLGYLINMNNRPKYAGGGNIKKFLDLGSKVNKELKVTKQIKELTDDEMINYIKKYKEEGPTLEEFTKRVNEQTGSNFTPEKLEHAYRIKVAYPHSTPIVDSEGKFIGGGLYNPPLDVSVSDRETLTKSIVQTRKAKGLDVPKKYQEETKATSEKAGEGRFTKQEVLEKIIQKTIDANPTDEYVQKTFPNFLKEIKTNPELANNENVWRTFTQDFPENKKLVVYGDDTVDFFTKGENLPEGMKQTIDLADTYGISMEEARRIKQMEPEEQVMEIKKLGALKKRTENAKGGII